MTRTTVDAGALQMALNMMRRSDSPSMREAAEALASTARRDDAADLRCERDLLGKAIRDAAVRRGLCREEAALTGPHLLLLAEDLANQPPAPVMAADLGGAPVPM